MYKILSTLSKHYVKYSNHCLAGDINVNNMGMENTTPEFTNNFMFHSYKPFFNSVTRTFISNIDLKVALITVSFNQKC